MGEKNPIISIGLILFILLILLFILNFSNMKFLERITGHHIGASLHTKVVSQELDLEITTNPPHGPIDYFIAVPIGILILALAFFIIKKSFKKLK